jgi:hypothetical protein
MGGKKRVHKPADIMAALSEIGEGIVKQSGSEKEQYPKIQLTGKIN